MMKDTPRETDLPSLHHPHWECHAGVVWCFTMTALHRAIKALEERSYRYVDSELIQPTTEGLPSRIGNFFYYEPGESLDSALPIRLIYLRFDSGFLTHNVVYRYADHREWATFASVVNSSPDNLRAVMALCRDSRDGAEVRIRPVPPMQH